MQKFKILNTSNLRENKKFNYKIKSFTIFCIYIKSLFLSLKLFGILSISLFNLREMAGCFIHKFENIAVLLCVRIKTQDFLGRC